MLWDTDEQTTTHNTITYTKEPAWLEQALLPYDVLGSIAHVTMLCEQGYLSDEESEDIQEALNDLYTYDGSIDAEDVHTFIEEQVTQETPAGKKMHTGRSRNDQVLVATRLYMKDASISVGLLAIDVIESLKAFAEENNELIPGYTHQQQAMPSSTGLWATSFADALIDDTELLKNTYDVFNCNPLGAAASYGTTLDIDRDKTTELLDFPEKQVNPIYCGNRGKQELMLLQALDHIMMDLQKLAEDIINFSEDQKIFEVPSEYCTGSSIMPQKENPDVLEIMRGKAEDVQAATNAVRNVIAKLPSGYNRDSQLTKKHLMNAVQTTTNSLSILSDIIDSLNIADEYTAKDEIYAAHTANQQVENGKAFRDAYHDVKQSQTYDTNSSTKKPKCQSHKNLKATWQQEQKRFNNMVQRLRSNHEETA